MIETGKVYRIKYQIYNTLTDSSTETELIAGVGTSPPAPSNLVGSTVDNDPSTIKITWDKVSTSDLPILGYYVKRDDGLGGDFTIVYDGSTNPQVATYTATNLDPGRQYQFKVQALDVNNEGDESTAFAIYACGIPTGLEAPSITDASGAAFTVSWSSPISDGGCPIINITVYIDDGAGGNIVNEVVTVTDGSVSYTDSTTLTLSDRGKSYRVAVKATNTIGSVTSSSTLFILADIPGTPTPKPQSDSEYTNTEQIKITFENTNTDIGGADLLESCLEMDDGLGGDYVEVYCTSHYTYYLEEDVVRGRTYRFRYRVRNAAGWSDYSETAYIKPSSAPEAPPQPIFVDGSDTTIELALQETLDDNGVAIQSYQLEIDSGDDLTSTFSIVTGYDGTSLTYTLTNGTDFSVTASGTLFRVRTAAINEDGLMSDYSEVLLCALGGFPSAPTAPFKVLDESSATSIMIEWDRVVGDTLPIQGYKLYADTGRADDFSLVYDGSNSPGTHSYFLTKTSVELTYRVYVTAINVNGEGPESPVSSLQSCTYPTYFAAPTIDEITETSVTISWQEPEVLGGCHITGYEIFWRKYGGTFAEYDATNVNNKPFLSTYTIDLTGQDIGYIYQVYVKSLNRAGDVDSDTVAFRLASRPDMPDVPDSTSDGKELTIIMTAPDNGGSNITTYELQLDYQDGNDFVTIVGGDGKYTLTLTYTITSGLTTGKIYRARYRAKNTAGWSDWSPIGYLLVAGTPSTPDKPTFVSATTSSITIAIEPSESDNGSPVTQYAVYIDSGNFTSNVETLDGTWIQGSGDYTLASTLTAGTVYRVGIVATNAAGSSQMSQIGMFAASPTPNAPATVSKDRGNSNLTSIALTWSKVIQTNTAIYGYYVLYADSGSSNFKVGCDLSSKPQTTKCTIGGLMTGNEYKFKVKAVGFNENGTESDEYTFRSCVAPTGFKAPTGVGTSNTITVSWLEPSNIGGCPIVSYAVFRNNGDQTDPTTEVNSNFDVNFRNNPHLRTAAITSFPASSEGKTFLFKIQAFTNDTSIYSPILSIKLAGLPGDPTVAPIKDTDTTDTTQITVELTEVTDTGNDPIVSYNLQMDDGKGGDFINLSGYLTNSLQLTHTITEGIKRGVSYRFRYRVKNSAGWSGFSPISTYIAAAVPYPPPAPTLASCSNETIELYIFDTEDNQGSAVFNLELWMNAGTGSTTYSMIKAWASAPSKYEVSNAIEGIISGEIYTFYTITENEVGYSEASAESTYAAASLPTQMSAPVKVSTKTNSTQITVEWADAVATEVPTTNYKLYVSAGTEEYELIYDGNLNTQKLYYTYKNVIVGQIYNFKVSSENMNGEGDMSDSVDIYACSAPSRPNAPQKVSATKESIMLSWTPPTYDGGCALLGYQLMTDSGVGGSLTDEVDTGLNTNPQTLSYNVTFTSSETGLWISFKIIALNAEETTESRVVRYMLAQVPDKPLLAPVEVSDETDDTQIVVTASMTDAENGGSTIIGYEFQIDNGKAGSYTTVQGGVEHRSLATKAVITHEIIPCLTYRVRFRGINEVGEGEWSDPVSVQALAVPGRPEDPSIVSTSNTAIVIELVPLINICESVTYELYYSDSSVSLTTFYNDSAYDQSFEYEFTASLVADRIYGFKYRAINSKGNGEFSETVYSVSGLGKLIYIILITFSSKWTCL